MQKAKTIVATAWQITRGNKNLFKFGFVAQFFGIIFSFFYLTYQIAAFRHSHLFSAEKENLWKKILTEVLPFAQTHEKFFLIFLISAIVFLVARLFFPTACEGAIVFLVGQKLENKEMKNGLSRAFFLFLPLFEIAILRGSLATSTFFSEWSFLIRNTSNETADFFLPILIFFAAVGVLLLFFLSFAVQFVILEKNNFTAALHNSIKLVAKFPKITLQLFLIFVVIELRVFLNIILFLFLPFFVLTTAGFFATLFLQSFGFLIAIFLAAVLFCFAAFLTGILEVFSQAIFTTAFAQFREE